MKCPTVQVIDKRSGKPVIINESDFDGSIYEPIRAARTRPATAAVPAPEPPPEEGGDDAPAVVAEGEVEIPDPGSMNAKDAIGVVEAMDSVDQLDLFRTAEAEGKDRKTVLDAIEARRAELDAEQDD